MNKWIRLLSEEGEGLDEIRPTYDELLEIMEWLEKNKAAGSWRVVIDPDKWTMEQVEEIMGRVEAEEEGD